MKLFQVYKGFEEVVKTESNILKSDVDKPFLCHICSKRYQYKKSLNLHLKKYHGIQPVSNLTYIHIKNKDKYLTNIFLK